MNVSLLSNLGKIAGLGGIALGVFVLLFNGVLQEKILQQGVGLGQSQAFSMLMCLMTFTFGIAAIGVIAWLIAQTIGPERPVPGTALFILAALMVVVIGAVIYESKQADSAPSPATAKVEPPTETSTITANYLVCVGEYPQKCPQNAVYLYCGSSVTEWAKKECKSFGETKLSDIGGNKCGYYVAQVTCTKTVSN
jgi:hypothetical protein